MEKRVATYEIHDERFRGLTLSIVPMELVYADCRWSEGPVWFPGHNLFVWSDIPNNRLLRWVPGLGVSEFRKPSNHANGNTLDRIGRLITCEHSGRRVSRLEADGKLTTIADRFDGKRLNSPNDVVVRSDNSVWFTDPDYGIMSDYEGRRADRELDGCHVYRVDANSGEINLVADDFVRPNGIAFSPDEATLYISDTGASHTTDGPRHIRAFDVSPDGRLTKGRIFCEPAQGFADGFRIDTHGNLWTSAGAGVNCYAPTGQSLGRIVFPQTVSNLEFGGPQRNQLLVTCMHEVYALFVATNGRS